MYSLFIYASIYFLIDHHCKMPIKTCATLANIRFIKCSCKLLKLLYTHDRTKYIIMQIVDSDHRNNFVKYEKDSVFYFWVFE